MTSCKKFICAALLLFIALHTFAVDLVKSDYEALESTIREYAPELLSRPSVKKLLNPLEWGDVEKLEKVEVKNPIVDKMKKLLDLTTFYSYEANKVKERIKGNQMWEGMGDFSYYFSLSAQEIFLRQFIAFECPNEYNAAIAKKEAEKAQERKEQEERRLAEIKEAEEQRKSLEAYVTRERISTDNKVAREDCYNYYLDPIMPGKVHKVLQKQQKLLSKGKPCAFKDGDFFDKFTTFIDTLTADKVIELSYQKDFVCPFIYDGNETGSDLSIIFCNLYSTGEKYSWFHGDNYNIDWLKGILEHFGTPLASNFINALDWDLISTLKNETVYNTSLVSFTPMAFYLFYYYLDLLKQQEAAAQ